jgi:Peroxidase
MVLSDQFFFVLRGTVRVPTTRRRIPVAGMNHFVTHKAPCLILGDSNYATMRFAPESLHDANAGLHVARALMEEVKKEFDWISYGDLWTLAGVAAIQVGDCVIL